MKEIRRDPISPQASRTHAGWGKSFIG